MQRTDRPHVVWFTEEEVQAMILEKLKAEGITAMPIAIQVTLGLPGDPEPIIWFGGPQITVILSNLKEHEACES